MEYYNFRRNLKRLKRKKEEEEEKIDFFSRLAAKLIFGIVIVASLLIKKM